ncbi:CPXCG motif-containing cysteine-rich protein [Alteromonas sediminis]|uniref:CPXCG motif-containing cysteine-rich protein n=1 Tax=Alteromonas sediminis TaxID=2259342 RepID=A0A3N5YC13_9ALTE|nr:CPXCG motif-containing cysteine-rich protein [Alteromonas sediminis]RPJ66715.1 CPXCG motif-containing cysteine-rich protein [Alteromonas sediminis]
MSLTDAERFECPYCMAYNDIDIDLQNDIGQQQITDCQVCCQPIEIVIMETEFGREIIAKRDDE